MGREGGGNIETKTVPDCQERLKAKQEPST